MPAPFIHLRGITKRYPGVVANRDVSLSITEGEVHAVVGENGAGKSTLMKVLYGLVVPDEGTVEVADHSGAFRSPAEAIAAGIGMVHQHFKLADNLSVLENVILGDEPSRRGWIDRGTARARLGEIATRYGFALDPDARVGNLGVGLRQQVEIVKVLYRGARILILDEPTAVLIPQEIDELLANLRALSAQGLTIIFISHKLDEVLAVSDRITVMRAGTTVATVGVGEVDAAGLARLMVGSELPEPRAHATPPRAERVLRLVGARTEGDEVRGLRPLAGVDLEVRAGEIVGVAGVEGNGQSELIDAILGLLPLTAGQLELVGEDAVAASTGQRRSRGLAYIAQDRQREGLLLEASLVENRILGHQMHAPVRQGILIDRAAARAGAEEVVRSADVRTPSVDVLASALSGGNQQKFIVGRELLGRPRLLVAAHPTRGVDVGAQAAIWDHLVRAREEGLGILLVSSELEELIGLSDRIVVLLRGAVVADFPQGSVTPAALGEAMTGVAA